MSLSIDGVWKVGVWAQTVWADGVWYEGPPVVVDTAHDFGAAGGRTKRRQRWAVETDKGIRYFDSADAAYRFLQSITKPEPVAKTEKQKKYQKVVQLTLPEPPKVYYEGEPVDFSPRVTYAMFEQLAEAIERNIQEEEEIILLMG